MSSTTDPDPSAFTASYWRSGVWLMAGCLGIGAAVIAIRMISWPLAETGTEPEDLFAEWDQSQFIELGDSNSASPDSNPPELPPLPPIEFPADFPSLPSINEQRLAESVHSLETAPTWATYETATSEMTSPVWFDGTIEGVDDGPSAASLIVPVNGPALSPR
ncbi:hypothetical protein GC163_21865 [bacterium]|nr:hypothetical protein [bacterium]